MDLLEARGEARHVSREVAHTGEVVAEHEPEDARSTERRASQTRAKDQTPDHFFAVACRWETSSWGLLAQQRGLPLRQRVLTESPPLPGKTPRQESGGHSRDTPRRKRHLEPSTHPEGACDRPIDQSVRLPTETPCEAHCPIRPCLVEVWIHQCLLGSW